MQINGKRSKLEEKGRIGFLMYLLEAYCFVAYVCYIAQCYRLLPYIASGLSVALIPLCCAAACQFTPDVRVQVEDKLVR